MTSTSISVVGRSSSPRLSLIHSPLVGPSSWAGVAAALSKRGVDVSVPDLRHAAESIGTIEAIVRAVTHVLPPDEQILVGHSGAGMLLPTIAEASVANVVGFVFVDAHLPPMDGRVDLADAGFKGFLDSLATDGRLPGWSQWWGAEAMAMMVPDEGLRAALELEMPSLPLAYFSQELEASRGWATRPCGYIRLSELYEPSAEAAEGLGWPVERFSAGHLHAAVDPAGVTSALLTIVEALTAPRS